ncbi:hypothetical protein, partial [uncultured Eubacterium sp.]|uniref:hypothetical protein n=1 Tax=uncultured Eubacterium sp. TaxID=165185 RepID=UPI0025929996
MICIGHFQRNLGMSFLRVTTSGALAVEYWMGVLALTDIYSADNIARQRDMIKIVLQYANGIDCFLRVEGADKILDYYRASKGAFLCIQKNK